MLYSVSPLVISIISLAAVQYVAALICLFMLLRLSLSRGKFLAWNFFILLAVFVGVITFLICYFFFSDKVFGKSSGKS